MSASGADAAAVAAASAKRDAGAPRQQPHPPPQPQQQQQQQQLQQQQQQEQQQQQQEDMFCLAADVRAAAAAAAANLRGRSVVSVSSLSAAEITALIQTTNKLKCMYTRTDPALRQTLQGKVVATAFYEPSTRTRCSFEAAALRLGAQVLSNPDLKASSSVKKGESLQDTARMFAAYADALVLRHPDKGSCASVASLQYGFGSPTAPSSSSSSSSSSGSSSSSSSSSRSCVLLSGGDGSGEHPTQALLDLYTIAEQQQQWFAAAAAAAIRREQQQQLEKRSSRQTRRCSL
ncbi:aspartate carbamoyltransferase, putative [Eimeria mitis]|uniref:Aspartate carbamoyltransferase, putative n=1 Tax=Eimeria mitis TaxID=44415 RepID=U6KCL4_9EIME|nr:aspartate carbamoyltransferase, putative [Eimeria mitis]CDJ33957.1 aspartate carbamoyltransferase, putative [Eimeria mitis]